MNLPTDDKNDDFVKNQVIDLATIGCSPKEIMLELSLDNFDAYQKEFEIGVNRFKIILKKAQAQAVANGDTTMLKWLGIQHLGQKESVQTNVIAAMPFENYSRAELVELIKPMLLEHNDKKN